MDAFSIGLIVALGVVVLTCLIVYKLTAREERFDQAYGSNAVKFLANQSFDRSNKNSKAKVKRTKNVDKKDTKKNLDQPTSSKEESDDVDNRSKNRSIAENFEEPELNVDDKVEEKKPQIQLPQILMQEKKPLKTVTNFGALINQLKSGRLEEEHIEFLIKNNEEFAKEKRKDKDEIKKLQKMIADKDINKKQLDAQITNLQTEKTKLLSKIKDEKEKYELFEQNMQPKLVENIQLREDCKRLQMLVAQAHQKLSETQNVSNEVNILREQLAKTTTFADEEARKNQLIKQRADAALNEMYTLKKQLEEMSSAKTSCETHNQILQRNLTASEEQYSQTINQYNAQIDQLNSEVDRLFSSYTSLRNETGVNSHEFNALKTANDGLVNQLRVTEQELSNWQRRFSELELRIQESTFNVQQTNIQYEQEKSKSSVLSMKNDELASELRSSQSKVLDLEKKLEQSTADATHKLMEFNRRNQELETEIRYLQNSSLSAKDTINQLNDQKRRCDELREINYKLNSTIEILTSENNKPNSGPVNGASEQVETQTIAALKSEIIRYKATMDSLRKKLELMEKAANDVEVPSDQENEG